MRGSIDELVRLLRERRPCVVLTGAGVSTESGIPDFRAPSGLGAPCDPREYATCGAGGRDGSGSVRSHAGEEPVHEVVGAGLDAGTPPVGQSMKVEPL